MSVTLVANDTAAPPLEGKLAGWMKSLVSNASTLQDWTTTYGSPLHITELNEFKKNIQELKQPLLDRNLDGDLYFARKANKLPWFVKTAGDKGIGIDTASLNEVEETLALGVSPDKIVVTAIGKNKKLVSQAIKTGCLLILDNLDELDLIEATACELNTKARVGLRFSGFITNYRTVFSRFGFPIKDAFELSVKVSQSPYLSLEVFHAHIDKYKTEERASAAWAMIEVIDQLNTTKDIKISGIDLGGGILINYLEQEKQWQEYLAQLEDSVLGRRTAFNANNDGLGLRNQSGKIEGEPELYPFWNNNAKGRFIENILDETIGGEPLHKAFSQRSLKLFFEPGRALLDNTGVTLGQVAFRKEDTEGNFIVGLAMNRMNLRPFRAEFCVDPILVSAKENERTDKAAYLAGCLCSESDLLFRRKIQLKTMPQVDDLYLFPNTAGYLAHHMEIGTHGNPIPENILIDAEKLEVLNSA